MSTRIIPAIMSGGAGTRLWPSSTDAAPKQFHALFGPQSLFCEAILRARGYSDELEFLDPIVICGAAHEKLVEEHLNAIGVAASAIALEPTGRNTAATAVLAAALAQEIDSDALVLLLPADHLVEKPDAFRAAIARAAPIARERIMTLGIEPSRPATGYGYIKRGDALGGGVYAIANFLEKPKLAVAEQYLAEGGYSWNAGMFLFSPGVLMEEFTAAPDIRDNTLAALSQAARDGAKVRLGLEAFSAVPSKPFDIAVMEKTQRGAVTPCDIGWADVGAWDEVWRLSSKDDAENAVQGAAAVLDGRGNLIRSEGPIVCTAGVDDLIVIATNEAVIVLPRERAAEAKDLLELSKTLKRPG